MTASRTEAAAQSPEAREHSGFAPREDCLCLHDNSHLFRLQVKGHFCALQQLCSHHLLDSASV